MSRIVRNGRRAVPKAISGRVRGRLRRALRELAVTIERTATIVAQTRSRLAGQLPASATRLVSLHDPDARPIRKGRIDRPVEFGYKAQVADNDDGVILDYSVEYGAAPDGPQLAPAVDRIRRRAGRMPRAVTADRGYGQPAVERDLQALGVRTVAIPRQSTTSAARKAIEHARGFRRLVKWRTGCEGRISYLKRGYGWDRTRLDGRHGAAIWCGHAVFAHNLVKIASLDR
jgi:IS5 family transposase